MLGQRPDPVTLAAESWDLVVIGGGITGAGILLEAARLGLKTLLVEQRDFAWGTSSRSSKMVHGGLRYIAQGDIRLTRHALMERERLLRDLPDLVIRETYLFPVRKGDFPGRWAMKVVLWLYDLLAGIRDHRWIPAGDLLKRVPGLQKSRLKGAMSYTDALTDDARLVIRTLHEGVARGGRASNYLKVEQIRRADDLLTLSCHDEREGGKVLIQARHVINATGAWADRLSGSDARVRPLRGSHLFVAHERLPVNDCLTVMHPRDGRPVFVFPWEGMTCIGTTDLDHGDDLDTEPRCTSGEVDYLFELVNGQFPEADITREDIVSTMAGVRPVISSGKGLDPSKERRDHAVWKEDGVVTVSGGKLTTFRLIALDALAAAGLIDAGQRRRLQHSRESLFQPRDIPEGLGHPLRAWGGDGKLEEHLEWILRHEMVVHLDDLLLRRTRLGNLRPHGAREMLASIEPLCLSLLGWDDAQWARERDRYLAIIDDFYSVPGAAA